MVIIIFVVTAILIFIPLATMETMETMTVKMIILVRRHFGVTCCLVWCWLCCATLRDMKPRPPSTPCAFRVHRRHVQNITMLIIIMILDIILVIMLVVGIVIFVLIVIALGVTQGTL